MTSTRTTVTTDVEQPASCEPTRTRAEILAPYLDRLGIGDNDDGTTRELPAIIDAGDYILELDEWERRVVRAHASGTDAKGRPWPGLVSEGLAFQIRCIDRAAALDGAFVPGPDQQAELIDELIIDGTLGITLLNDLQWAIDRLIREGQVRVAGRLAEFRNAVNHNVSRVRSFVGNATFAKSEAAAKESSDGQIQARWPDIPAELDDDDRPPPRPVQVHRRPPQLKVRPKAPARIPPQRLAETSSSRPLTLTIVLVISLLVWFYIAPQHADSELPRELTERDFSGVPAVSKVEARPPSLYVTFSALRWQEMNELERWQAMDQVGTIAGRADYIGAHMRTSDGETVGRWSQLKGLKAVKGPRGAS